MQYAFDKLQRALREGKISAQQADALMQGLKCGKPKLVDLTIGLIARL